MQFALRRQPFPAAETGPAGRRQPLHQALRERCRFVLVPQHDVDPAVVRSDGPAQVVREQQEVCLALVDEQDQIGQEAILDRPWSERVRRDRPVSVLVLVLVHHVRHPRLQQRNDRPDAVLELPGPHGILDQEHAARLSSELFHRPNDATEPPDHRASVAAVPHPLPAVGNGVETDQSSGRASRGQWPQVSTPGQRASQRPSRAAASSDAPGARRSDEASGAVDEGTTRSWQVVDLHSDGARGDIANVRSAEGRAEAMSGEIGS